MLFSLLMISSIVLFLVAPIISLGKYYSASKYSVPKNILWVIITFFTWPLVPIVLAMRNRDALLIGMFSLSFGVWFSCIVFFFEFISHFVGHYPGIK